MHHKINRLALSLHQQYSYPFFAGQAGAIRVGLSKALACHSDVPINDLITSRLLVTDYRKVERKKPGQKKARKKFAWLVHTIRGLEKDKHPK